MKKNKKYKMITDGRTIRSLINKGFLNESKWRYIEEEIIMKFQRHYNYEYGKILDIQFNNMFNRYEYLVLFGDGVKIWTYPQPINYK